MIIVTGEIEIDPAAIDALRGAAITMMAETAKEEGCLFYRFYQDLEHPGKVRVYEEWESEVHLQAHMETPHMQVWRAALADITLKSRRIQILTGATARDL